VDFVAGNSNKLQEWGLEGMSPQCVHTWATSTCYTSRILNKHWGVLIHASTMKESTTIMSSIPTFQPKLIPMFFHMDPLENIEILFRIGGLLPLMSSSLI
jgi:hypothetical protein